MAKLNRSINNALLNTGMNVLAKLKAIDEINVHPELESIFSKSEKVIEDIKVSMLKDGFYKEEPIVIGKLEDGEVLGVVDGHTRLQVAIEIGLDEVPVVEKVFESLEEAKKYTRERQLHRRNLSQAEIFAFANELETAERTGEGRATERLAKELGVSASVLQKARTVEKRAPEEIKEQIKSGEKSINQAYQEVRKPKPVESFEEEPIEDDEESIDIEFDEGVEEDGSEIESEITWEDEEDDEILFFDEFYTQLMKILEQIRLNENLTSTQQSKRYKEILAFIKEAF